MSFYKYFLNFRRFWQIHTSTWSSWNQDKQYFFHPRNSLCPLCSTLHPSCWLSIYLFVLIISFVCSRISYNQNDNIYDCVWLISTRKYQNHSYHHVYHKLLSFYCWVVSHFMSVSCSVYVFICWWTFGLHPVLRYYKYCCHEYWYTVVL